PETPPATVPATVPAPAPAAGTAPAKAGPTTAEQEKALEELLRSLAPGGDASPAPGVMVQFSETAATSSVPTTAEDVEMPSPGANEKWVFTNGRWIRVRQEPPAPQAPAPAPATGPAAPRETPREIVPPAAPQRVARKPVVDTEAAPQDPFGWKKALQTDTARIIAINLRSLQNGDPRMNIVIRDNDVVWVPTLEVGEFYVNGEVNRPGVYSLTGRKITVKQAMTAAGNLGQLAWPENSALVRRIGDNQEQVIPINVEAIFQGRDPDIYLKPNDVILVGTSAGAPFLAVVRNAFRMTYGFGFIYDRNFSDPLIGTPDSRRFTMW
ncbi:MAG TPA: SLBB domain-containing protein, partial [Phycisphaerae bacterium]|nr:SLBB domain-containing protein [Phycisphaerae bacterium]